MLTEMITFMPLTQIKSHHPYDKVPETNMYFEQNMYNRLKHFHPCISATEFEINPKGAYQLHCKTDGTTSVIFLPFLNLIAFYIIPSLF